jgi:hypothetical protein
VIDDAHAMTVMIMLITDRFLHVHEGEIHAGTSGSALCQPRPRPRNPL